MDGAPDLFQGHVTSDHHHRFTDQGVGMIREEMYPDNPMGTLLCHNLDKT